MRGVARVDGHAHQCGALNVPHEVGAFALPYLCPSRADGHRQFRDDDDFDLFVSAL